MEWASAAQGGYDDMLSMGREYRGPLGFPYRWIQSGTTIAESLRPHLSTLYDACAHVSIVACRRSSICTIDNLLPTDLGWYSMSGTSRCRYMRRHLARWMTCYLYPQGRPNAGDWDLCLHGMGSGPPKAAALLNIGSYGRALVFRKAFAKALGREYSIYDLVCFLCLAAGELRKEVAASRRRKVCKGILRRGGRYLVQRYDGARTRYIGSCDSLGEAKKLYARGTRSRMAKSGQRARIVKSAQRARMRGVYPFRDKYQAFLWRDGVRVYVGLYRSKAAAAAAIRARRNDA